MTKKEKSYTNFVIQKSNVGDKSHSTRSKEEIQKSNKVQTDKNNDHIRSLRKD